MTRGRPTGDWSRLDRLVYIPAILLICITWAIAIMYSVAERGDVLDRIESRLAITVATLADANELAEAAAGTSADQKSANRTAAIWRALLQYPAANFWLESDGKAIAGERQLPGGGEYISANESRGNFTVHAALPMAVALEEWRRSAWLRGSILLATDIVFLLLTYLLARALRQRAIAERETARAMTRLVLRERALEAITQGITITDNRLEGSPIIYTNPAFASLTRHGAGEVIGRTPLSFFEPDVGAQLAGQVSKAEAEKKAWRAETYIKRKANTSFLDNMSTSLIINAQGEVTHAVTVHEDVTELRQREDLLLEAQKMESVGQLTGGIAHDFNNLLTAIKSNAEDLKEDLKGSPFSLRQADIVLQAADRGAGLVAQLMAFARKQELQPKTIDVNELLDSFSRLLRSTLPANIDIKILCEKELSRIHVDPGRLESALLNLAINSRDAMPEGGCITIETMHQVLDAEYVAQNLEVQPGLYVLIAVTDSGGGMPQHVVERAFTPFFTTKEVGKGTGLGLSMVYGFVKQSGGHAKIYSEVGLGTAIKIYLPAVDQAATATARRDGDIAPAGGSGSILLVEDDELVRQSISAKLTALGYAVLTAKTAAEAIEILQKTPDFDLVFSDVIMPGPMNGADLVREVRRRWPNMNLLLTSGYTEATVLGKVDMPVDIKLLSKPYSNADLARTIRRAIGEDAA
ncbi:MAG: ATP-binding protein [Rhodospirillaceae bacterium]